MRQPPCVVHSDGYYADIGLHVFPMRKFRPVREETYSATVPER